MTGQADDVYHFNSIAEFFAFLKKTKFAEKMNMNYHYALTDGTKSTDLTYREIESASHLKTFKTEVRQYRLATYPIARNLNALFNIEPVRY
ncbi:hypothetical protein [Providencia hangzhouensis]|uniref:hypothetical protein n=1 Tax=Providencia hangzhouensis TaxID=3031799 RepID=UPI00397D7E04